MKEFDPIVERSTAPIEIKTPVKQEYKFVGSIQKIPGLRLYSYNTITGDIKLVKVQQEVMLDIHGKTTHKIKALDDPKLLYVQALNLKNAARKFGKYLTRTDE